VKDNLGKERFLLNLRKRRYRKRLRLGPNHFRGIKSQDNMHIHLT